MALLLFYLLLALVVSFYCSILEAVLLSVTPSYIESQMAGGKQWASLLLKYKKDIDRPLASILSLNTISHTVGSAGVGAQAAVVFQNISLGVISGVLTLLILVFSELIPKTIGANSWKQLAYFTTVSLRFLNIAMYPLVLIARLIAKIFPAKEGPSVDRNEVVALAEIGRREGVFSKTEARILQNLVRLRSVSVRDIMTPRTVMVTAPERMTVKEFAKDEQFYRVSRVPLYEGSRDNIHRFVHKHDVMNALADGKGETLLNELARMILVVPDSQNIYNLYSTMVERNEHIVLVVEEFGGTAGIATMEDVLETLLGLEITDEFDSTDDLREYARSRWMDRARRLGIRVEGQQFEGSGDEG